MTQVLVTTEKPMAIKIISAAKDQITRLLPSQLSERLGDSVMRVEAALEALSLAGWCSIVIIMLSD